MLTPAPAVVSTFWPSRSLNVLMPESGLTRTASVPCASMVATAITGAPWAARLSMVDGRAVGEVAVAVGDQPHGVARAVALLDREVDAFLLVEALVDAEQEDRVRAVEQPVGAQRHLVGGLRRDAAGEDRRAGECRRRISRRVDAAIVVSLPCWPAARCPSARESRPGPAARNACRPSTNSWWPSASDLVGSPAARRRDEATISAPTSSSVPRPSRMRPASTSMSPRHPAVGLGVGADLDHRARSPSPTTEPQPVENRTTCAPQAIISTTSVVSLMLG